MSLNITATSHNYNPATQTLTVGWQATVTDATSGFSAVASTGNTDITDPATIAACNQVIALATPIALAQINASLTAQQVKGP